MTDTESQRSLDSARHRAEDAPQCDAGPPVRVHLRARKARAQALADAAYRAGPHVFGDFNELLAITTSAGLRPSETRRVVLEILCQSHALLTAPELHDLVRKHGVDAPLSTVYRALKDLEDLRIAARWPDGRGKGRFGLRTRSQAIRVRNTDKDQIVEIDDPILEQRLQIIAASLGVNLLRREITLHVADEQE